MRQLYQTKLAFACFGPSELRDTKKCPTESRAGCVSVDIGPISANIGLFQTPSKISNKDALIKSSQFCSSAVVFYEKVTVVHTPTQQGAPQLLLLLQVFDGLQEKFIHLFSTREIDISLDAAVLVIKVNQSPADIGLISVSADIQSWNIVMESWTTLFKPCFSTKVHNNFKPYMNVERKIKWHWKTCNKVVTECNNYAVWLEVFPTTVALKLLRPSVLILPRRRRLASALWKELLLLRRWRSLSILV